MGERRLSRRVRIRIRTRTLRPRPRRSPRTENGSMEEVIMEGVVVMEEVMEEVMDFVEVIREVVVEVTEVGKTKGRGVMGVRGNM